MQCGDKTSVYFLCLGHRRTQKMVVKLDVRVALLLLITLFQLAYTTWSFLSGRWSITSDPVLSQQVIDSRALRKIATHDDESNKISQSGESKMLELDEHRFSSGKQWKRTSNASKVSKEKSSDYRKSESTNARASILKKHLPINRTLSLALSLPSSSSSSYSSSEVKKKIFDNRKSDFVLEKSYVCRGSTPLVVIIVCSATGNFDLRTAIRKTWASQPEPEARILFLVGRHSNSTVENSVLREDEHHNDVIMANFADSYANLSLKSMTMLNWVLRYCSSAKYLLKTDDDTFLNTPLLVRDLRQTVHRRFIMGNVIALAKPVREPKSKWYTPASAFNRTSYPTYVSGMAYVISGDAILDLYSASKKIPLFWLEDIYITGLLAGSANIQRIFNGKFDGFKELADVCSMRYHIVRHRISVDQMQILWSIVQGTFPQECS